MKNTLKLTNLLIVALLVTTFGCSDDNQVVPEAIVITVQDLEATIDENPTNGEVI